MRFRLIIIAFVVLAFAVGAWVNFTQGPADTPTVAVQAKRGGSPPQGNQLDRRSGGLGRATQARSVLVAPVRRESVSDRLEAIGTVNANESVTVTAKTQGVIRSIRFEDGQTIKRGEEIASIDAGVEDAALDIELANLEQQKNQLARVAELAKSDNVSKSKLEDQMALVRKAEGNVAAARVRSTDRRIVAPFSGIVGTRRISVGALVSPGTVVATLEDISVVKLDFAIPETFLSSLRPGLDIEAIASAYPRETFKGKVFSIDSHIDPKTRSVNVRAIVPNLDLRLRSGMLIRVDLIKDRRDSLVIPEAALQPENDKQYVFVVGANNIAERTPVTIGRRRMGSIEILEGLKEGDWTIKEGMQDLRSGAKVNVVNSAELKQAAPGPEGMTRPE